MREFNAFVKDLAIYCFNDCVNDFSAGQRHQTQEESHCVNNCVRQSMDTQGLMGEVIEKFDQKYNKWVIKLIQTRLRHS